MRNVRITKDALKSVLLASEYPNGNFLHLLKYTDLLYDGGWCATLSTNLPEDHWAFTHTEEPGPRFRLSDNKENVWDSVTGETMAYFNTHDNAQDYVDFLNNKDQG
jgi:hypothetical protein